MLGENMNEHIERMEDDSVSITLRATEVVPKKKRDNKNLLTIAQKYKKMLSNGRILSNRAAMEVLDNRVRQLADRIDVNDAPDRMMRLQALYQEFRSAYKAERYSDQVVAMAKLDDEFQRAHDDYKAWEQLMQLFDLRRKMVDSEVKTIKQIKAILTAEDAHDLVAKLLAVVLRVVQDPIKLRIIHFEFSKIIGENNLDSDGREHTDPGDTMEDDEE